MIETLPPQSPVGAPHAGALRPLASVRPPASAAPQSGQCLIRRAIREDDICVLTFDRPDSSANIFDRPTLLALEAELQWVGEAAYLKGLILTSAKRGVFIAGADLKSMSQAASAEELRQLVELGQRVMNRLAGLRVPTVAAIHGAAVGGGYELCLACDYRVASPERVTKIGLPETQLGLLPAWGGSTRLPRLIGLPGALDIILGGKTLAPKPALKRGMVDELAPAEYLIKASCRLIKKGKPKRPARLLLNNRFLASLLAARLRAKLRQKTRGHYPAVDKALEVACRGVSQSVANSLDLERAGILELAQTPGCRNLIRIFFLQERAKKCGLPKSEQARAADKPIARCAVIGSGVMGAGIAQWLSSRQLPVILRDLNAEALAKGMAAIAGTYRAGVKRHLFTPAEARQGMDHIYPAPGEVPLRNVDLIIEAAVEKLELKRQIFQRLDELAGPDTILATNTSALPISELAASTRRPERVLGLHFFNPVHRMQLVEVVAARQTAPELLERALRFVQQIGKLPVLVKDSPGFLVNRILMPYLVEAANLFAAGAGVPELDRAMLDFGMPMGPLALLDEVGIDVALHVAHTLSQHFSDRMNVPQSLHGMVQAGLLGRKAGRGFYLYPKGKAPRPNAEMGRFQSNHGSGLAPAANFQDRLALLMINEAARCLEEQIVSEPADVDFAMIMGTGFAPFRGGPLRYADSLGADKIVAAMERLVESGAAHFQPCASLREMAKNRKRFYND
jgi:3-hydroxyacyl-CoA dehydrogenase / enoyl-CoA hydratase / 3-hydroxybutyryl-CoA epimerase